MGIFSETGRITPPMIGITLERCTVFFASEGDFFAGIFFLINFQVVNIIFYNTADSMKKTNLPHLSRTGNITKAHATG